MDDNCDLIAFKSRYQEEFRRFSISRKGGWSFNKFHERIAELHRLQDVAFTITYKDHAGNSLSLRNDADVRDAVWMTTNVNRLCIETENLEGDSSVERRARYNSKNPLLAPKFRKRGQSEKRPVLEISEPKDFRVISSIIDVDRVPQTHRRVKLSKDDQGKPLGFYVRDGDVERMTTKGVERVRGVFISRLVPGGLAARTGLLAIDDEVLEVNGINVQRKSLDAIANMMIASSANLVITVKPANQRHCLAPSSPCAKAVESTPSSPQQQLPCEGDRTEDINNNGDMHDDSDDEDELRVFEDESADEVAEEAQEVSEDDSIKQAPQPIEKKVPLFRVTTQLDLSAMFKDKEEKKKEEEEEKSEDEDEIVDSEDEDKIVDSEDEDKIVDSEDEDKIIDSEVEDEDKDEDEIVDTDFEIVDSDEEDGSEEEEDESEEEEFYSDDDL